MTAYLLCGKLPLFLLSGQSVMPTVLPPWGDQEGLWLDSCGQPAKRIKPFQPQRRSSLLQTLIWPITTALPIRWKSTQTVINLGISIMNELTKCLATSFRLLNMKHQTSKRYSIIQIASIWESRVGNLFSCWIMQWGKARDSLSHHVRGRCMRKANQEEP